VADVTLGDGGRDQPACGLGVPFSFRLCKAGSSRPVWHVNCLIVGDPNNMWRSDAMREAPGLTRRYSTGITLIEVVVALAVLAILVAVALPRYQDYTVRSKVSEGLSLAAAAKLSVMTAYLRDGSLPIDNEAAQLPAGSEIAGRYVSSVMIDNGNIVVVYGNDGPSISGRSLVLESMVDGGSIQWNCYSPDIAGRYLPPECRHIGLAGSDPLLPPEAADSIPDIPPAPQHDPVVDGGSSPPYGHEQQDKGPPSHAGPPEQFGPGERIGMPEHAGPPDGTDPREGGKSGRQG